MQIKTSLTLTLLSVSNLTFKWQCAIIQSLWPVGGTVYEMTQFEWARHYVWVLFSLRIGGCLTRHSNSPNFPGIPKIHAISWSLGLIFIKFSQFSEYSSAVQTPVFHLRLRLRPNYSSELRLRPHHKVLNKCFTIREHVLILL
jgi:hypothetical protein